MGLSHVIAATIALSCTSTNSARVDVGIMTSGGASPVLYALARWPASMNLRAYRVDDLSDSIQVSVLAPTRDESSPLYGPGTGNVSWKYSVRDGEKVPQGALWVCMPAEWSVLASATGKAEIRTPRGESGSITAALRQEGVEVVVRLGSRSETLYFHLGM